MAKAAKAPAKKTSPLVWVGLAAVEFSGFDPLLAFLGVDAGVFDHARAVVD